MHSNTQPLNLHSSPKSPPFPLTISTQQPNHHPLYNLSINFPILQPQQKITLLSNNPQIPISLYLLHPIPITTPTPKFLNPTSIRFPQKNNQFYQKMSLITQPHPKPPSRPNSQHYLIIDNKNLKCICQLCTCGKHKCPRPRIKSTYSTSYNDHYKYYTLSPSQSQKQQYIYQQRHYNPQAMLTNYQNSYLPHQFNQASSKLSTLNSRIMKQVPFIGQSSYRDQYKPYLIIPNQNNSDTYQYQPVKFQGTTSYQSHYVEPPKINRNLPQPSQTNYKNQLPFNSTSTYKIDFPGYIIQPHKNIDNAEYRPPQVKFQGETTYNDEYKGYQIVNPEERHNSKNACIIDKLNIPAVNYINDQNHIYYDEETKKFV